MNAGTRQDFADRWLVVTGASSGIGRAIAIALVAQDARVLLVGRDAERLAETARLAGAPDRTLACRLDLTDLPAIAPAVKAHAAAHGRIYGLCHAAGAAMTLPLSASRPDRVQALMTVNFQAGLELARVVCERSVMHEQGGSLLWISSVYGHVGAPGQVGYCATKGAIAAAARAMALELAPRRVRVNTLSPGLVRTGMTETSGSRMSAEQWARIETLHPLGVGDVNDVARAATFLLHPLNAWITGADMVIDGGYSIQ